MEENKKTIYGLNIASLVLGIVAIVLCCMWFISIPCAILSLVFGIIGIKKQGKGMAIAGIITGAITLAIWVFIFGISFVGGFIPRFCDTFDDTYYYSSYHYNI